MRQPRPGCTEALGQLLGRILPVTYGLPAGVARDTFPYRVAESKRDNEFKHFQASLQPPR